MGALAKQQQQQQQHNQWLPQDDILLKTSIEDGASLESLARGAVEFSRVFTIKELQDRWLSLLYDPVVAIEACARMAQFEQSALPSKSKKVDIFKESNKVDDRKRKRKSIRSCYYAMRKRVCNGTLYQSDLSFPMDNSFINELQDCNFDGLCNASDSVLRNEFFVGPQNTIIENPNMIGDACTSEGIYGHKFLEENNIETKHLCNGEDTRYSDCRTSYGRLGYPSSLPETANWTTDENMLLPNDTDMHLPSMLDDDMSLHDFQTSADCTDDYFADIFANEDEVPLNDDANDDACDDDLVTLLFPDEDEGYLNDDGVDAIDDTCDDGFETHLLDIIPDASDDEMCNIPETSQQASVLAADSGTIPVKRDVAETRTSKSNFGSCSDPQFPEYRNGEICCILNTEDPEIPLNVGVTFPSKKPAHNHKKAQNKASTASSSRKDNTCTQPIEKLKKSHSTKSLDGGSNCAANGHGVKIEAQERAGVCQKSVAVAVKTEYPDLPRLGNESLGQIAEPSHVQMNLEAQHRQSLPNLAAPVLEEADEELLSSESEDQFSDSDANIPYFSDVESMILESELCPVDHDTSYAAAVAKYQQDDAVKSLIRLEQNARSSMHRDMASHGSFAVLFGRHSKHYIKKPEVLLGRATEDVKVDIDLTREGNRNKISRRQASIKMEKDGTFTLKNLGKFSIYVNSDEISPGLHLTLISNCLIEIRGMPFIFAVNEHRVKQYLDR